MTVQVFVSSPLIMISDPLLSPSSSTGHPQPANSWNGVQSFGRTTPGRPFEGTQAVHDMAPPRVAHNRGPFCFSTGPQDRGGFDGPPARAARPGED